MYKISDLEAILKGEKINPKINRNDKRPIIKAKFIEVL